jgi:tetratricopeptide (TPR) repeat protein
VVHHFEGAHTLPLTERFTEALNLLGIPIPPRGEWEQARPGLEAVVRHHGEASEPLRQAQAALALNTLGLWRWCGGDTAGARARFEEVVRRYREFGIEEVRVCVASALYNLGALHYLQKREKITEALRFLPEEPHCLGNLAYIAFLQGRHEEARAGMAEAVRRGGEPLRRASLEDADLHPLPEDEAWRRFLRELPL